MKTKPVSLAVAVAIPRRKQAVDGTPRVIGKEHITRKDVALIFGAWVPTYKTTDGAWTAQPPTPTKQHHE